MDDWRIAAELALRLGADFDLETVDEVTDEIARGRARVRRRRPPLLAPRPATAWCCRCRSPRRDRAAHRARSRCSPTRLGHLVGADQGRGRSRRRRGRRGRDRREPDADTPDERDATDAGVTDEAAALRSARRSAVRVGRQPAARRRAGTRRVRSAPRDGSALYDDGRLVGESPVLAARAAPVPAARATRRTRAHRRGAGHRGEGHLRARLAAWSRSSPTRACPPASPRLDFSAAARARPSWSTPPRPSPTLRDVRDGWR